MVRECSDAASGRIVYTEDLQRETQAFLCALSGGTQGRLLDGAMPSYSRGCFDTEHWRYVHEKTIYAGSTSSRADSHGRARQPMRQSQRHSRSADRSIVGGSPAYTTPARRDVEFGEASLDADDSDGSDSADDEYECRIPMGMTSTLHAEIKATCAQSFRRWWCYGFTLAVVYAIFLR